MARTWIRRKTLFHDNFLFYQEDLKWMGPKAFRFYLPAALDYLLGPEADDDSDAAISFCGLIEYRSDCDPAEIEAVGPVLREGIPKIIENFERYGCDRETYGNSLPALPRPVVEAGRLTSR